jgi:DNA polymerase III subunit chi
MAEAPTDVLFYHLERNPLDGVLPSLVARSRERNWRVVIQVGSEERLAALDQLLWTYDDQSFLAHGTKADKIDPARQPVFLTTEQDNPNGAHVRFLVDGATTDVFTGYVRIVILFNGHDAEAVKSARAHWKAAKAAGCTATYWQQNNEGRWEKKA